MITMKCYYTLFTKDGIITNYESYILIFIIITFIILSILFYKCGYHSLEDNIIYEITTTNNKNKTENISTVNLGNCEKILKDMK